MSTTASTQITFDFVPLEEPAARPIRLNPPAGFREGHMGDLACPHRDLSVCPGCLDAHDEIVDVIGACFWIADPQEREVLEAQVAATRG